MPQPEAGKVTATYVSFYFGLGEDFARAGALMGVSATVTRRMAAI
jgi:hypothetical protein